VGAATLVASVSRVPRLGTSTFRFILMARIYHDYDIFFYLFLVLNLVGGEISVICLISSVEPGCKF